MWLERLQLTWFCREYSQEYAGTIHHVRTDRTDRGRSTSAPYKSSNHPARPTTKFTTVIASQALQPLQSPASTALWNVEYLEITCEILLMGTQVRGSWQAADLTRLHICTFARHELWLLCKQIREITCDEVAKHQYRRNRYKSISKIATNSPPHRQYANHPC